MKTLMAVVAYYDNCNKRKLVIEAQSIDEACLKTIAAAADQRTGRYRARSWDPEVTLVGRIAEGNGPVDGDEDDAVNCVIDGIIPFDYSEEAASGAGRAAPCPDGSSPELKGEFDNGEAIEPLRTTVAQGREALEGSRS
jgi:hypothetical protein